MPENQEKFEEKIEPTHRPQELSKSQKISVVILAFFAFALIIIWPIQFKKSLNQPFERSSNSQSPANSGGNTVASQEENLRTKDTDGDGLTDWDELNIYKTSPYLEDSDSDGFSDRQEVESQNDPNCPTGRDCYDASAAGGQKNISSNEEELNQEEASNQGQISSSKNIEPSNNATSGLENLLSGQSDAATIRQALLDFGMDQKMLDNISDEDLLKSYQDVLEKK